MDINDINNIQYKSISIVINLLKELSYLYIYYLK